jgi:hypothetical protein
MKLLILAVLATAAFAQKIDFATQVRNKPVVDVRDYGAKGNGVTDDAAAINAAIQAAPIGAEVLLPPTVGGVGYLVVGEGDHVILINKAIHLRCMDRIKVSASVPGTRDIIEVVGPVGETWFSIKNCNITPVSGAPGRVGVEINATSTSNGSNYIARMVLEGNTIGPFGSSGVKVSFPDYQDGYFNSVISRNMIYGGIDFTRAGDTIEIANNTLVGTGPKSAIYLESVFGASQVDIHHNSIVGCSANVTLGHSIHVEAGSGVRIRSNNIEPVGCSLGDSAVYLRGKDLNPSPYPGTTGHIYGASVTDNSFVNIPLVVKFGLKVSARNHGTAVYGNRREPAERHLARGVGGRQLHPLERARRQRLDGVHHQRRAEPELCVLCRHHRADAHVRPCCIRAERVRHMAVRRELSGADNAPAVRLPA